MTSNENPGGNDRPRLAGGIFIFFSLLIGAVAGVAMGQPSIGMIGGFAIGVVLALIVWLVDYNRAKKGN